MRPLLRRVLVCGLGLTVAAVAFVAMGDRLAGATTSDSIGLPNPKVRIPLRYGAPLVGRNDLYSAAAQAHLISGVMDIEGETEGILGERVSEWFYGELEIRLYVSGAPTTLTFALYPFTYHSGDYVTAGLIPPQTVTAQHEDGIQVGSITFTVQHPQREIKTASEEPAFIPASLKLRGRGPYEITFKHADDNGPPAAVLPPIKQIRK